MPTTTQCSRYVNLQYNTAENRPKELEEDTKLGKDTTKIGTS
jgi:hypothetical protein